MDREEIEHQLKERERRAFRRGLDRSSSFMGLATSAAAVFFWFRGDHWAASLLGGSAAFVIAGTLIHWRVGQVERTGPEPAVNGSRVQAFRYRWYHSPQMVARMLMAALIGVAGFGYAIFLDGWAALIAGCLWAAMFFGVAYGAWRVASPNVRDTDRARAAKNLTSRQGT